MEYNEKNCVWFQFKEPIFLLATRYSCVIIHVPHLAHMNSNRIMIMSFPLRILWASRAYALVTRENIGILVECAAMESTCCTVPA